MIQKKEGWKGEDGSTEGRKGEEDKGEWERGRNILPEISKIGIC